TGVVLNSGAEALRQARAVATGELRWTDAHQATIAPAVAGDLLFLAAQQQLIALTLATGRELWSTGIDETIDAVVAKGDHVVIASANGFRVLQAKDGRQLWSKAVTDRLSAAPAIDAGRLFVATSDGTLQAFDVSSGTPRWQTAVGTAVGRLFTQPHR